jgi:hypothetical protein
MSFPSGIEDFRQQQEMEMETEMEVEMAVTVTMRMVENSENSRNGVVVTDLLDQ